MLVSGVTGPVFMGLTTPEPLGLHDPQDVREPVRRIAAAAIRHQHD